ncbi:PhzF family phenazine biosynthesis isomerase [Rossellomorea aquimaris]|uniref:PhzF family phenazine biosynthesis protein n=1 Tax=Rossellomorea aquimaris TaxID=189382 RepID=UPI001CD76721|nr:PhzF family phenazine biosynthesis isomerase [Rossellomorea aquimaris]MCA1060504.1 PhzF family phenazine biosynthesis isomerase [Rossellomorea aquimaris]
MKSINILHYDAFTTIPEKGNPAGIVLHGDNLTDEEKQEIAYKVGFNETSFPVTSDVADLGIRFFTPGNEMSLCGHGTIATMHALKTRGLLEDKSYFTIETKAGILPIKIESNGTISMKQGKPQFREFDGSKDKLAHSIGLERDDINEDLPIVYGSTGNWTLLVPINSLDSFQKMKPENQLFPSILQEFPHASVHPFCLETHDYKADMHGRHFSSAYSGTAEDPVTDTASAVMGAYYAQFLSNQETLTLLIEQGHEMNKDGRVRVQVTRINEAYEIEISGQAVYVNEFDIHYGEGRTSNEE